MLPHHVTIFGIRNDYRLMLAALFLGFVALIAVLIVALSARYLNLRTPWAYWRCLSHGLFT